MCPCVFLCKLAAASLLSNVAAASIDAEVFFLDHTSLAVDMLVLGGTVLQGMYAVNLTGGMRFLVAWCLVAVCILESGSHICHCRGVFSHS